MGGEWRKVELQDVANEITVGFVGSMTSEYVSDGIPFLRSKNVDPFSINTDDIKYISPAFHQKIAKSRLSSGDVVIVRTGKPGTCAVVPDWLPDANCSDLVIVRCGPEINNRFLAYYVNAVAHSHVNAHLVGAVQQHFNIGSAKTMGVKLPPLHEQKRIVDVLGTLDDKIELNRQMNSTLEAMAQALFKSWFVDFDPVIDNALAAGNPIPEELQARADARAALGDKRKPLPEAIQKQFPSRFVLTEEMGWVPEGWREVQVKDIAKVIKGKSYKSSELEESKTALVTLKSFNRGGGYRLDGLKEYTGTYKPEQEVFAGDLIIAYTDVTQAADVIGKPAMVVSDSRYDHLVVSLDVSVVRPEVSGHKYFLYGIAQTERFQDHTYSHSTGTTVLHLGKNAVPDFWMVLPKEELVNAFVKVAEPTFQLIDKQIAEVGQLSALRDTLLPKLLSGELRIPDAEKLAAEAI